MKTRTLVLAAVATLSPVVFAAPTPYEFETVTAVTMHSQDPSITGVLRNASTPTTITFVERTNISFQFTINRCVPLFLTMMEKPGKYYLTIVVDPAASNVQLSSCSLQVR
jgi:hypothetical protein